MEEYFNYMCKIGWNEDYANLELLKSDLKVLEEYYTEQVEKENEDDVVCSLGFVLDFVRGVVYTHEEVENEQNY